jgi:hypothetical protein
MDEKFLRSGTTGGELPPMRAVLASSWLTRTAPLDTGLPRANTSSGTAVKAPLTVRFT